MVILLVFNSFNVVKNLKKPDPVARQMPPLYTTSFPSAKFSIPDYEIRARNKNGGDLIQFAKKGPIFKRLKNVKTSTSECVSSEITICKRKWLCFSIYRPPSNENFEVLNFKIDVTNRGVEFDKLDEFCDLFKLTNLVNSPTCFTKMDKSTIDLILINKERCFQKTKVTETGLSDFHRLINTFLRSQFC